MESKPVYITICYSHVVLTQVTHILISESDTPLSSGTPRDIHVEVDGNRGRVDISRSFTIEVSLEVSRELNELGLIGTRLKIKNWHPRSESEIRSFLHLQLQGVARESASIEFGYNEVLYETLEFLAQWDLIGKSFEGIGFTQSDTAPLPNEYL